MKNETIEVIPLRTVVFIDSGNPSLRGKVIGHFVHEGSLYYAIELDSNHIFYSEDREHFVRIMVADSDNVVEDFSVVEQS